MMHTFEGACWSCMWFISSPICALFVLQWQCLPCVDFWTPLVQVNVHPLGLIGVRKALISSERLLMSTCWLYYLFHCELCLLISLGTFHAAKPFKNAKFWGFVVPLLNRPQQVSEMATSDQPITIFHWLTRQQHSSKRLHMTLGFEILAWFNFMEHFMLMCC